MRRDLGFDLIGMNSHAISRISGTEPHWLHSEHLKWKAWRAKHPNGEVLSSDTGHRRNYGARAYAA